LRPRILGSAANLLRQNLSLTITDCPLPGISSVRVQLGLAVEQ
jgi:hypothetical protein